MTTPKEDVKKVRGFDGEKVMAIETFGDALILVGLVQSYDDLTLKNIMKLMDDEADDIGAAVITQFTDEEFEAGVVLKFKICRSVDDAVVEGEPNLSAKGKLRLAKALCSDATSTAPATAEKTAPDNQNAQMMKLLTDQMQALVSATQGAQRVATQAVQAAKQPLPISLAAGRKLKLKELIDQTSEDDCPVLSDGQIAKCYARFEATMGVGDVPGRPWMPVEEEPTSDQLAALHHLVRSGLNPFGIDFGIFTPFGQRMVKKVRLCGERLGGDGVMHKIELYGPATYAMWSASWKILENCCVMLDIADLGKLVAYKRKQDKYHERYGEKIWALQYQTDSRTRNEQLPRIKREALAAYNKVWLETLDSNNGDMDAAVAAFKHGYNPQRPWDFVLGKALTDTQWWLDEMEFTLLGSFAPTVGDAVAGDAVIARDSSAGGKRKAPPAPDYTGYTSGAAHPPPAPAAGAADRPQPRKKIKGHAHNVVNGHYVTSRNNIELCEAYNGRNGCNWTVQGIKCGYDPSKLHVCSKCLRGDHTVANCPQQTLVEPGWLARKGAGKGGGRSGGRGGGKGGGRVGGGGKGGDRGGGRGRPPY